MRKSRGFTLVELLVVIGIIAVLISILLPTLARARQTALLVSCQSNFRQIYSAVVFYANENKGYLPMSSTTNGDTNAGGTNGGTYVDLSELLGKKVTATSQAISPVFTCTEAVTVTNGTAGAWAPGFIRTVFFNPRAFPGKDQNPTQYPQRKLSSIRNSADKIAIWEGPQISWWNWTSEPRDIFLDGWRYSWGNELADPSANDYDIAHMDQAIDTGANVDDGWDKCSMRFRHMKNSTTPVVFFDGHVETRKFGTVKAREVCVSVAGTEKPFP